MSNSGTFSTSWHEYRDGWTKQAGEVIEEALITIYVNGLEIATIMATPRDQNLLALGFLKNEGLLESLDEVEILYIGENGCCVDLWLNHSVVKPQHLVITSGCGGGVTFGDPSMGIEPLQSDVQIKPQLLRQAFRQLQPPNSLYARSRGVHAAGLLDPATERLLAIAEDVGRHNAMDKLAGACMKQGVKPRERVLLVTGRISSEMMHKAARMGCPIVASRTSPTSLSVEMARAWNITLVGYVRQGSMRVYSCPERVFGASTNNIV
ncbi:MAG: formate dehydrogenase accessory sulfurtransferase FdhD, partial [Chloroflexi bacterium]|nr:formate dehydrogenase accessory sulfurtransferase FdhD [Chloroflexota bacterium]